MKKFILCIALLSANVLASPIVGKWQTIDEETGNVDSIVTIDIIDNKLQGRVSQLLDPTAPDNAVCEKCSGDLKDTPIVGLKILSGFDCKKRQCKNGKIVDPRSGKVYSSKLKLKNDNTLDVRGYIGSPMFGQSRIWTRVQSNN